MSALRDATRILERVGAPNALVLGDVMLDHYTWGEATRVSPEAPVLVLRSDLDEVRPGGAASVGYLLAALDAQVTLCGVVGADAHGRTLRRLLGEAKIDDSMLLEDASRVTTSKERIIGRTGSHPHQLVRVDREDDRPLNRKLADHLLALVRERLGEFQVVLVSDYRKGLCSRRLLERVLTAAAELGIPTLVDPARGADFAQYRGATLLKPNRIEAETAAATAIRSPQAALNAGRLLRERSGVDNVLITLDVEGMALIPAGGRGTVLTTQVRNVHDVTGAGDMALAMLGLCAAGGIGWLDAAHLTNLAAGLEVEKVGISPVTREELATAMREGRGGSREEVSGFRVRGSASGIRSVGSAFRRVPRMEDGLPSPSPLDDGLRSVSLFEYDGLARPCTTPARIVSLGALLPRLAEHRRHQQRIVLANGCFDLLHVGHVRCLAEAAAQGDVLVVALNSDASVGRLKGPGRPIVNEHDRAAMLAALACVDYVTTFDDDTPRKLLRTIKPDVLVKGAEARPNGIPGADLVASYGGRVHLVTLLPGMSTTTIVERLATEEKGTGHRKQGTVKRKRHQR